MFDMNTAAAGHDTNTDMIELTGPNFEVLSYISNTGASGYLWWQLQYKLIEA
jgi:hypothetical protein